MAALGLFNPNLFNSTKANINSAFLSTHPNPQLMTHHALINLNHLLHKPAFHVSRK